MSTSSQHAALSFRVCRLRLGYLRYLFCSALMSRVVWNAQVLRSYKCKKGGKEKGRERSLDEEILPLMSVPPLGDICLTFTVCWTAAAFSSLFPFFQSIPSLLPITQSAFHLLSVHFCRFCCLCSCSCLIAPTLYATPAVARSSPVFWREQNLTR